MKHLFIFAFVLAACSDAVEDNNCADKAEAIEKLGDTYNSIKAPAGSNFTPDQQVQRERIMKNWQEAIRDYNTTCK